MSKHLVYLETAQRCFVTPSSSARTGAGRNASYLTSSTASPSSSTGTVSARAYTGNDGGVRASLEVTAEAVEFLSSPRHNSDGEGFTEVDDAELPEGFR